MMGVHSLRLLRRAHRYRHRYTEETMKKLRYWALIPALVLTLAACAGQNGTSAGDDTTTTGNQSHEHVFGEWTVKTAATCGTSGLKERTCACGEAESETIPKAIHNYANGTCADCGKTQPQASEGLQYTLSDDGAGYIVSGIGTCTDSAIVLPDIYEGKPVIGIGEEAFFACESVTSVVISDYVTQIDRSAFYACLVLESVVIPGSVESIGEFAFKGCSALTNVSLAEGLAQIGHSAFDTCETLESIVLPNSVTRIDNNAFRKCVALTSITLSTGLTDLGNQVFVDCIGLVSIVIPNGVAKIEDSVFDGCSALTSITIPGSVTEIGKAVFHMCRGLRNITFEGTKQQWEAIEKGENWDINIRKYTVHCTDGDIEK